MTAPRTVAVPVLPVSDIVRSTAWYQRLGFEVRAEYDGYAIVAFDGAEVHLNEFGNAPPATETFSGAYLRVTDVDAVHAHWSAMGAPTIAAPEDQFYGIREFATEDLDGNLWRVGSPIAGGTLDGWEPDESEPADGDALAAHRFDELADGGTEAIDASFDPQVSEPESPEEARSDGGPGTLQDAWLPLVEDGARCAGCGLVNGELAARAIGAQVRDEVHPFGELLLHADDDAVRRRPAPDSWSALEYGVHVRDTLTVFAERIVRTLAQHQPELGWWDHEAAIADGMANESDVSAVVDDMQRNAAKLSEALRMVTEDDWERTATRRSGERFTIELLARFVLHEVVHHRTDAERALGLR